MVRAQSMADGGGLRLEPDVVLPSQERSARIDAAAPEKRLMLATLADAVFTFRRTARVDNVRARRLFVETARWFESPSTAEPFAFLTICDTLGLDPQYIRGGLRQWRRTTPAIGSPSSADHRPTRAAV